MNTWLNTVIAEFARHPWRYALLVACVAAGICVASLNKPSTAMLLRVGYSDFFPYVARDELGRPIGLAVELVQEAAARSGVELRWIAIDDAEQALRTGQIDLYPILTATAERKRDLYPSIPWWEVTNSLLSLRDHPLKNPAAAAGRRIAIRNRSTSDVLAAVVLPGAAVVRMPTGRVSIGALCAGSVDGVLLDARLIYEAMLDRPEGCADRKFMVVPLPQTSLPLATFARSPYPRAVRRLYAAIEQATLDGTMTAIANRWFAIPQQRYVQQRLAGRQRYLLGLLFAACVLLLTAFTWWHYRRTLRIRRTAENAWTRAVEAERRFETFMAHTPAISFIKDAAGRMIYVNHAFVRFHGFSAAQSIGRLDTELFGESVAGIRERDAEVLQTGRPVQYLLPLPGTDGALYYWLVLKFLLRGEAGETRIGVVAIDISDQQRAAELIARSEERYRMLFEEAPVAIHEIDRDGLVTRINRAGRMLCGYSESEIIGRHASEFVAPHYREESRAAVHAKMKGTRPLAPFERHYQRKDGRLLRVEVHETAIFDHGGEIQGLRSCLIDLTERYEAQERLDAFALQLQQNNSALALALESARQATRLKSQFLANMSHEIRTPMNGVLGMTELLVQSGLTEEQRSLALSVTQSGEHLLAIINDILDFSKIESGKLELEATPFDPTATIEAVIELMAPTAHIKNLELTYWIAAEMPARVRGDAARLRQVLLNLLGNALKFTAEGEIAIQATFDAAADRLRVSVADTGIGIPEAAIPHLFAAFTQADNSTTRRFGGTGLGLTIAKSIVELMDGEIGIESRYGHGSTFWFTASLPAVAQAAAPPAPLPPAAILIVDDNASSRAILERHIALWGLRAETAVDGAHALALLRSHPFDAALIDTQIPGTDVVALLHEIAAESALRSTSIIRLSSIGILPDLGVASSIHKPVKPEVLYECLSRILQPVATLASAARVPAASSPLHAARGRVLIAEDNAVNQRVARLQVAHCGFDSDVVSNGQEALDALSHMNYALVLMDCQMPGMDGYAATRELRRRENGARHLPVIALTANAFATDREACLEAGMDDHLSKPVSLRSLAAILDRWSIAARES
uniref:Sensory/regulatory protein RpfC n=1 Tax=Solibacter usitatus (strain Ellin6076) TaxID=234267 RepID=Q027R6_SOLUE